MLGNSAAITEVTKIKDSHSPASELLSSTPLMTISPNHKALINQVGKVLWPCSLMLNNTVSGIYCRSLNNFYGHFNSSK